VLNGSESIWEAVRLGAVYQQLMSNYKSPGVWSRRNEQGEHLAHVACKHNRGATLFGLLEMAKKLTVKSSKSKVLALYLYGKDPDGDTALHHAVRADGYDCVQLLLAAAQDAPQKGRPHVPLCVVQDASGWSPLHLAVDRKSSRVVKALLASSRGHKCGRWITQQVDVWGRCPIDMLRGGVTGRSVGTVLVDRVWHEHVYCVSQGITSKDDLEVHEWEAVERLRGLKEQRRVDLLLEERGVKCAEVVVRRERKRGRGGGGGLLVC
jgi:hypothetical protein